MFISYDSVGNERKNFTKKVDNIKTKLEAWRSRKLSLIGRCLIAKTLGLSQTVLSDSTLETRNKYAFLIQSILFQSLGKKKKKRKKNR